MSKCLLFIRTSTRRQETESQLKETKEYAEYLGYTEFETIDKQGASAYGVTDEYLELIEEMKRKILNDPQIKCVVCWAMNRLFRNIRIADELKEWFVEHKIQLEIKEPHIRLLEPDGSLSNSSEMLFHFFSVYNKQQIDELKAKSHRAKVRDKALTKYLGARIPFGYMVENHFVVPHPVNEKILRELFTLYGSGEWSYNTIAKEFNERYSVNWDKHNIKAILSNTHYYDGTMFPPIITELEFNKAAHIRKNFCSRPQSHHNIRFGAKLIVCPECGKHYTANVRDYRCINGQHNKRLSIKNMDGLLWFVASHLEGERMYNSDTKEELLEKKAVIENKINSTQKTTTKGEKRAERAKKMALDGLIEIEEYKKILKDLQAEQEATKHKVEKWKEEIKEIERFLEQDEKTWQHVLEIADKINSYDEKQMFDIIHRWIKKITFTDDLEFTIETIVRTYKIKYNRYGYPSRWFTIYGKPLAVPQFIHNDKGSKIVPSKCTPKDISVTLAWLTGSVIV